MLPFLLPNSIFYSRTTVRGSQGLRSLARRQQRTTPGKASTSRSLADKAEEHDERASSIDPTRKQGEHVRWLLTQGQQYRRPNENGPNWLGGSVPFPMNPSFKPPTPLSDKTRTQIFNLYMKEEMGELELGSHFGLGVSRIKAILRLKKLEQLWMKFFETILWSRLVISSLADFTRVNDPLLTSPPTRYGTSQENRMCQRRFQADMERYLGVPAPSTERDRQVIKDRQVPDGIDVDFDKFSIGKSKQLQRVFFEAVPEGQYPPLAQYMDVEDAVIEEEGKRGASGKAAAHARALAVVPSTRQKDGTPFKAATQYQWFYPTKAGRAPHTFVDVGHRYLQKRDTLQEEKSRHLSEAKGESASHQLQLVAAQEALHLRAELHDRRAELALKSKAAMIRDKRKQEAEQELFLAHSKVVNVDVKL